MDSVAAVLAGINWAAPSWDLFVYLFFVIGSFLYGFSLGRDRIIVILVAIYMALAVVGNAPLINQFTLAFQVSENIMLRISFFLGVFVVLFFLLSRSALLKTIGENSAPGKWWQVIVFSILQVGLLISITMSFLPPETANAFTEQTRQIFLSDQGRTAWLVAPIVFMALGPKPKKKDD
ncbi:MAG: hypothetical protein ACOYUZ_02185 [Patescibacteria group bacterium]